jgi:hypothetical protein
MEKWIWGTALPAIVRTLVSWGKAFVEWVAPYIPPMLSALGRLLQAAGNWLLHTGLPFVWAKLQEWGKAFVVWIGPGSSPCSRRSPTSRARSSAG